MGLKLREALTIYPLTEAKVVVEAGGMDREITSANIIEVPTVSRWMSGGELVFTSGFAFQNSDQTACRIIRDLAGRQIAALAIKPGEYMHAITPEICAEAERMGLPLLEIPPDMPYMMFMQPIFERLINEQLVELKQLENAHKAMLSSMLETGGIDDICHKLGELLKSPVAVLNANLELLSSYAPDNADAEPLLRDMIECITQAFGNDAGSLMRLPAHRWNQVSLPEGKLCNLAIIPVDANHHRSAYLIAESRNSGAYDFAYMAMEQASTLIALELQQEMALEEREWQLKGECLDDLIWQNFTDELSIMRRAELLHINLSRPFIIAVVEMSSLETENAPSSTEEKLRFIEKIQESLRQTLVQRGFPVMLQSKGDRIIISMTLDNDKEDERCRKALSRTLNMLETRYPQMNYTIGAGSVCRSVMDAKNSYKEAIIAIQCSGAVRDAGKIIFFDDSDIYSFLWELSDSATMTAYYQRHLGPLLKYDQERKGDLLKTLQCYFDNDCNLRKTAEALFMHKNSIINRIHRIEELIGASISNSETFFQLQLCLKLKRIL